MPLNPENELASALGRSDEGPNIQLAEKICKTKDAQAVKRLMSLLGHKKTAVRNDAIKVLYEIGTRKPDMIIPYAKDFLALLHHKDNRMIWGAMHALSAISEYQPELLAKDLSSILDAMDSGSVITRDHGIYILCNVSKIKKYHEDCMELLLEQIEKAPVNQVPMYAEKTAEVISQPYIQRLNKILQARKDVYVIESKKKRLEKLIRNLKES